MESSHLTSPDFKQPLRPAQRSFRMISFLIHSRQTFDVSLQSRVRYQHLRCANSQWMLWQRLNWRNCRILQDNSQVPASVFMYQARQVYHPNPSFLPSPQRNPINKATKMAPPRGKRESPQIIPWLVVQVLFQWGISRAQGGGGVGWEMGWVDAMNRCSVLTPRAALEGSPRSSTWRPGPGRCSHAAHSGMRSCTSPSTARSDLRQP